MHQEKKMLAHISEDGTRVQTVADHLQGTAVLCGQFAAAFDAQQQGTWLGLLHDIGKYSTKFQKRLQGGEKVDHSTAGAQVAARYGQIPLAFAIAGHHSGLPDGGGRSDTAQNDEGKSFYTGILYPDVVFLPGRCGLSGYGKLYEQP